MTSHSSDPNLVIGTFFATTTSPPFCIHRRDVDRAIKQAIKTLGLTSYGYTPELVSTHSYRAGGAMAMHLQGISRDTIRKMGRWSSDTFLIYIHKQISAFATNISKIMSRDLVYKKVQGNQRTLAHMPAHRPTVAPTLLRAQRTT